MKIYQQGFSGRTVADVHREIGRRGAVLVRLDQAGDKITAYFEIDERALADSKGAADVREVSAVDVMKI